MKKSTMIKITGTDCGVSLKTISRAFRSPHNFIVLNKDLERLEKEKYLIVKDCLSFAELRCHEEKNHKKSVKIVFWWMKDITAHEYAVRRDEICLPFDIFKAAAEQPGSERKVVSASKRVFPKFEFQSRKNLREVVSQPILRHKFAKFLATNMRWENYKRIVLYDDFVPYSFVFDGYTSYGLGICGGIILHGQEKMETSYYSIHT